MMDTTSLRIKFTPLFNNTLTNGSKYCLEIVPEVSYVQNLDKISWKQEKDLIEYTIPMTYKVILKRRDSPKNKDVLTVDDLELNKTYHSCVDLLPPSSMTTSDYASGDITRIISDTYILGKISAKFNKEKLILKNPVQEHVGPVTQNNSINKLSIEKDIVSELTVLDNNDKLTEIHDIAISRHELSGSNQNCLSDEFSLNKVTNTDNVLTVCRIIKTQSVETTTHMSIIKDESKQKLSISPICSINTNDYKFSITAEVPPSNFMDDRAIQRQTNGFNEKLSYILPKRNEKRLDLITINVNGTESSESVYKTRIRELPEARVAKFIKKMETEIMPLKIMLNDILQKCSRLGFTDFGVMDNDSVVEQIVNSLSFEVEAVPQDNVLQLTTTTKAAPLNVKIRVRKKEAAAFKNGVISLPNKPNQADNVPERFRLVSSDHTIMSFSVVMEADFQKPAKKSRGILGIFKPTSCLGSQPDDEVYTYLPSTTYQAKVNDGNSQSDGALTKITLMKNEEKSPTRKSKDFFGRCKPGGCLDPPFGEDRLPYSPAIVDKQSTVETVSKSQRRTRSVLSNKIFHKKKKSIDIEALDNNVMPKVPKDASVTDLYQSESQEPYSTNIIMTYPPMLNSSEHHDKKRGSRICSNSSKNSFNEHSGSYFMIPKKQRYASDKNVTAKKENHNSIQDLKLPDPPNKKTRESGLIIENLATEQHLSKFADSNNIKELTPLKSSVSDSSDIIVSIPIQITTQIEHVENNKRRTESQENRDLVTRRENSISSNLQVKLKTSDGKLDSSFLQSDNIVLSNNIPKVDIPKTDQLVFENKPTNKSVVTIEAKHELSDLDLTNPTLKKVRKSFSKTFTGTPLPVEKQLSETINHEYDNLHHLWQNQNDPTVSDIKLQKENELVHETDKKNETLYKVDDKDILEQTSNIPLSNFDNNIKEPVRKENDNIKPRDIVFDKNFNSANKDYVSTESFKQNDNVIDTQTNKNDSVDEQGTSNITQVMATATEKNMDSLGLLQQETKFELATEPSPASLNRITSSKSNIRFKPRSILDIDKYKNILTIENNELIKNNSLKLDDETVVFFKGVLDSKNSSKTNSENDFSPYEHEDNPELNKYDDRNMKSFQSDDLSCDQNLTRQDNKENVEQDPPKYITEDISILEKGGQATSDHNNDITEDLIKSILDEEVNDSLNNHINNENENITEVMKYDEVSSIPNAVSYAIDNELDKSSKKNSDNDLLLFAFKDNVEFNECNDRNNNIYQYNDCTEDKTVTSQDVDENGEQNLPKYITEDKPEVEKAGMASSERNSYSYVTDDRVKIIKDEELSDYSNDNFNDQNDSKTELMKYDEVSSVQDAIKLSSVSKSVQRESEINHNQDLLNEIIDSKIGSSKIYKAINESKHPYITDKMQNNTLKDSTLRGSTNKAQSLILVDDSEILKFTDQNKINSDKSLKFNHYNKTDSKTTTYPEQIDFENCLSDKYILSKPFETTPTNKARPKFVNFAVQSYVDDKNQTIVKSLDADNLPKGYPQDSIKVSKRYLDTDEEIVLPIDLDNNLYIKIKNNKLKDNIDVANNNMDNKNKGGTDKLTVIKQNQYHNELDPIKRNGIIAENIRKTLEVVYEKELLPLRSNISELNENIKMLTARHMLVASRMFVTNKSRSTKIIPIFKKCSCTRR